MEVHNQAIPPSNPTTMEIPDICISPPAEDDLSTINSSLSSLSWSLGTWSTDEVSLRSSSPSFESYSAPYSPPMLPMHSPSSSFVFLHAGPVAESTRIYPESSISVDSFSENEANYSRRKMDAYAADAESSIDSDESCSKSELSEPCRMRIDEQSMYSSSSPQSSFASYPTFTSTPLPSRRAVPSSPLSPICSRRSSPMSSQHEDEISSHLINRLCETVSETEYRRSHGTRLYKFNNRIYVPEESSSSTVAPLQPLLTSPDSSDSSMFTPSYLLDVLERYEEFGNLDNISWAQYPRQ